MRNSIPKRTSRQHEQKRPAGRLIALALGAAFILLALLTATINFVHPNHAHDYTGPNGSCAVCSQMAAAENLLKNLSGALCVASLATGRLLTVVTLAKSVCNGGSFPAPFDRKVQLNS